MLKMLGINERHVCVCKGEQQRVSGWSLTPILTHQYVTVAHFTALQRKEVLHCIPSTRCFTVCRVLQRGETSDKPN